MPVDSPERFRVEILFSPGASHNPFEVVPLKQDHTLPVLPRMPLHAGEACHTGSCLSWLYGLSKACMHAPAYALPW